MPPAARIALSCTVAGLLALGVAACAGDTAHPAPSADAGAPSAVAPDPEPTPSGTPAPTEEVPVGTPVELPCEQILPPEALGAFSADPGYAPLDGSLATAIVEERGVACGWLDPSSGATVDVAVADLPEIALTDRKNAAFSDSNLVPTYGDEGYFRMLGGRGEAQVFVDSYWVLITSDTFLEPGDVVPIAEPVISTLLG